MQSRKQQQHNTRGKQQQSLEQEHVTRVSIARKVSKKNLTAKSPLRFTNKYRKNPTSVDVNERRVRLRLHLFSLVFGPSLRALQRPQAQVGGQALAVALAGNWTKYSLGYSILDIARVRR